MKKSTEQLPGVAAEPSPDALARDEISRRQVQATAAVAWRDWLPVETVQLTSTASSSFAMRDEAERPARRATKKTRPR